MRESPNTKLDKDELVSEHPPTDPVYEGELARRGSLISSGADRHLSKLSSRKRRGPIRQRFSQFCESWRGRVRSLKVGRNYGGGRIPPGKQELDNLVQMNLAFVRMIQISRRHTRWILIGDLADGLWSC